jgi:large subunit ribosomal protein L25
VITGTSEGVRQGGKLQVITRKLLVKGNLEHLPDTLDIDITNLPLGKSIVAGDLKYKDIQIISPKATIICMVKMTRAATAAAAQPTE